MADEQNDKKRLHQRKMAFIILGVVFLTIAILYLFYYLIWGQFEVYTDDAYVNGNLVGLMSQVPGNIIQINTDDTMLVREGQTLIKLDPSDAAVALQRAQANLALTVRQVRQYFDNAQQAETTLALRKADLIKAKLDVERRKGLVGNQAISGEEMQHYQTAYLAALAQYDSANFLLNSSYAIVENSHLYTHPEVERAKANFKDAYLNYVRTTVSAPLDGFVAKRMAQVGQHVAVNTPLLAIVPLHQIWVDANYKESQLQNLRIGQPVTLYADAYPDVTYHGKVQGINAGTGAAFSLLPPQNATGNWIKIVQRLPVRVSLNPKEIEKYPLQIGLSMRVTADIHNLRGRRLPNVAQDKPLYATTVFAQQLAEADMIINRILRENSPDVFLPRLTSEGYSNA